ncbi:MAG: alpha/beta fold hydrolase [Nitrososphaerales archaeon]
MQSITANGVSLNYAEEGSGTPVIFVHESLNDYRSWLVQVSDFSNKFRSIAYSRRNHYPNPWSAYPEGYSIETESSDLVAFINGLEIEAPVHLVGSSFGAFVCALVARDHANLVRSLVLAEPPILSMIPDSQYFDLARFEGKLEASVGPLLNSGKIREGAKAFIDAINGEGTFDRLGSEARERMLENGRTLGPELTTSKRDKFTAVDARKISAPTLLVRGENSPVMFQVIMQELLRSIPKAQVVTIRHSSHLMHTHNPLEYDEAVLKFLVSS